MDLENAMFMWGPLHFLAGMFSVLLLGELYFLFMRPKSENNFIRRSIRWSLLMVFTLYMGIVLGRTSLVVDGKQWVVKINKDYYRLVRVTEEGK